MTLTSFGTTIPVTGPNIGFAGTVSRFGERVIAARQFVPYTSTNNLNFGDPAVLLPNTTGGNWDSVADFIAHAASNVALLYAQFAGAAVREVKTQLTYPSNVTPGASPMVGLYSSGQMAEVLERGSITIPLAVGAPNSGDQVYTRVALNGAVTAGVVGDWETNPAATDQFTVAATLVEGNTSVTLAASTNTQNGQLVGGPGIQPGSYIVSGGGTTTVVLNKAPIQSAASTSALLTLSNLFAIPGCVARTGYLDANGMLEITFERRYAA